MSYDCILCEYFGSNKYDFKKHISTKKHINNMKKLEGINVKDNKSNEKIYTCENCNTQLKHNSSFIRHRNNCMKKFIDNDKLLSEIKLLKNELQIIKKNKEIEILKKSNEIRKLKYNALVRELDIKVLKSRLESSKHILTIY